MNKGKIAVISRDVFQITFMGYLLLLILENLQPGFVSDYLNMRPILFMVCISGMIVIATSRFVSSKAEKKMFDYRIATIVILATTSLTFLVTRQMGIFALIFAEAAGLVVLLFSVLLSNEL